MPTTTEDILPEDLPALLGLPPASQNIYQSQHCFFTTPLEWNGSPPEYTDYWSFSEMTCFSSTTEQILNAETGASFYLSKDLSYSDFFWFFVVSVVLIFWIFKTIWGFLNRFFNV